MASSACSSSAKDRRAARLDALGLMQMRDEAAVGRLADRARVEEDEVGVLALGSLGVAERLEHALHALGVVLVHLTPEGGDVEALGVRHRPAQRSEGGSGGHGAGTRV